MDDAQSINVMGHQRSLHDRLQRLFKTGFTAIDIAGPLMTYDWTGIVEMSRRLDRMLSRL
jgi:hypothetical protein